MTLAIEILKREIAQRELAQKHNHLRKEEVQLEIDSLNKALKKLISEENSKIDREEKILYWAKQLEHKSLSLHELVENAEWLLENVR